MRGLRPCCHRLSKTWVLSRALIFMVTIALWMCEAIFSPVAGKCTEKTRRDGIRAGLWDSRRATRVEGITKVGALGPVPLQVQIVEIGTDVVVGSGHADLQFEGLSRQRISGEGDDIKGVIVGADGIVKVLR